MVSFFEKFLRFLFPPRCSACRTLLSPDETSMCHVCRASYDAAKENVCPLCLQPLCDCDCPNRFLEHQGLHTVVKLFRYRPHMSELPENRLIYRLKRSDSESVTRFLAQELAPGIRRHMDEKHAYVLVGCPRSKSAIRKYGYDHVQLMGKTLSGELGIPYIDAVEHIGHAGAQKTKNRKERLQAAVLSYRPNKKKSLKGKTVILLDDVVTTGATLAACARATRKLGARGILCAVIGSNFRYSDLAERKVYETERKRLQFPYRLKR